MNYFLSTLLVLLYATAFAQTSTTVFLKYPGSQTEVPQKKAKFSRTTTQHADGSVTDELRDLKKDSLVSSKTLKGKEPIGKWVWRGRTLNYDFSLTHPMSNCGDTLPGLKRMSYLENNDSIGYKAPILASGQPPGKYLAKNAEYPRDAMEEGIEGTVYLEVILNATGKVENVFLIRGTNSLSLDKEAARLAREMVFSSPATLNGQAKPVCFWLPVKFQLR